VDRISLAPVTSPAQFRAKNSLPEDLDALLVGLIRASHNIAISQFTTETAGSRTYTVCGECGHAQPMHSTALHGMGCKVGALIARMNELEEYFETKRNLQAFTQFQGPIGTIGEQMLPSAEDLDRTAEDEQIRQATMRGLSQAIATCKAAVDQADGFGEPWTHVSDGEYQTVNTADGRIAVDMTGSDMILEDEALYASRIAACLNFCAGISTEDLVKRTRKTACDITGPTLEQEVAQALDRLDAAAADSGECAYCGPVCYGGAAHNARVEDGALYGTLPGELPAVVEGGAA
jgi:hypothetical protein